MRRSPTSLVSLLLVVCIASPVTARPASSLDDLRRTGVLPRLPAAPVLASPKGAKADPLLGESRSFWTYDLSVMPPRNVSIQATCRGVGETVAVYVDDAEWDFLVDDEDVAGIVAAFDEATPAGPGGITARNGALFGETSDIDGNGRVIVFLYRIPSYQGSSFDGFFRAEDLMANDPACEMNPSLYCSNEAEMLHVQAIGAGTDYMAGVMAHEHQHLIHFGRDPDEQSWINEAMSELAMSAAGYEDDGNVSAYVGDRAAPLETDGFVSYGAVMLWGSFLYELLGADFVRALVAAPGNGREGLEDALAATGSALDFAALFGDWAAAVAAGMVADGSDLALVAVPDVGPDEELVVALEESLERPSVPLGASSFRVFGVTGGGQGARPLEARFDSADHVELRVVELASADLVIVANPGLRETRGTLTLSWGIPPATEDVAVPDAGGPDVVAPVAPDAVEVDGSAALVDVLRQADVGDEELAGAGGGDCSGGGPARAPWVLLLFALVGMVGRRRGGWA